AAVAAIEAAVEHEMEVATNLAAGDAEVEAFAAWLRQMRPKQQAAVAGKQDAEAATAEARAALAAARAAVRAVEELLEQHALAAEAEAERRAQGAIDEIAQHGEPIAQK
ncbi:MAG TPA: hypothetical protein VFE12_11000, partial [Acetobacteraceae bacterium]|nr:hypothetical protein [Acetobacteraceae bacterium]